MRRSKLVGTVSNCAVSTYHGIYAVRLKTAPTGGESVVLFLESIIVIFLVLPPNRDDNTQGRVSRHLDLCPSRHIGASAPHRQSEVGLQML